MAVKSVSRPSRSTCSVPVAVRPGDRGRAVHRPTLEDVYLQLTREPRVKVPGGTMKESVYYVPSIIAFGLIAATFSNLTVTVVRNRESGI
jgi:hypothetical protein